MLKRDPSFLHFVVFLMHSDLICSGQREREREMGNCTKRKGGGGDRQTADTHKKAVEDL